MIRRWLWAWTARDRRDAYAVEVARRLAMLETQTANLVRAVEALDARLGTLFAPEAGLTSVQMAEVDEWLGRETAVVRWPPRSDADAI